MTGNTEAAELIEFGASALQAAGQEALRYFRSDSAASNKAESQGGFDPVTLGDREAERVLREHIGAAYPGDAILGEEFGGSDAASPRSWTIDPIDGTRGFLAGFVQWGMLLAFCEAGRPLLGFVHQPFTGETWVGTTGRFGRTASWRQGDVQREITTRECATLEEALMATTDPYLFEGAEADAFAGLRGAARLTRYGTDCYAYSVLATGCIDLVVENVLQPWDVHALIPLVEGAGGIITDWRGGDCSGGGQVLAAGSHAVHEQAMSVLRGAAISHEERDA